jgi:hypothetical protein
LASHRASLSLDEVYNSGDQNSGRNITSVSTALASLGADDINAEIQALLNVLGMSNHVHVENACFVESVDDMFRWDTNGGDEELGTAVDDDADELVELAFCVIIAENSLC